MECRFNHDQLEFLHRVEGLLTQGRNAEERMDVNRLGGGRGPSGAQKMKGGRR